MTLEQYYLDKYNLIIKDKKQPLLKVQGKRKTTNILLIP